MLIKLIKYEIHKMIENHEQYKLDVETTLDEIQIRLYVKPSYSDKIYLMVGPAMVIARNGSSFKAGEVFEQMDSELKTKLINLACDYCNIKAGRGESYDYSSSNWSNITSNGACDV